MFGYSPYYHQIIRKMVISFGKLFSDLTIERFDSNLEVAQVIKVPIAYGPKEKWLRRLQENPDLSKQVKMELPRMSFEIVNYQYDPERKLGPNQNYLRDLQGRKVSTPIPYNIDMVLYVATRTQDDMLNIMEQILPFFAPAVTIHVKVMDDPLQIIDVPITINNITNEDNWDEDFEESRIIVTTISFTMKTYIFGPIIDPAIIKRTITDIAQRPDVDKYDSPMDSRHTAELNPFAETEKPADPHSVDEFFINW